MTNNMEKKQAAAYFKSILPTRFYLPLLLLVVTSLVSCSDNDDIDESAPTEFTPSVESTKYFSSGIDFGAEGGKQEISFDCNKRWKASSTESWCTVSPSNGAGNGAFEINVTKSESIEKREAVITLKVGEQNNYITVRQGGAGSGTVHVEKAGTLKEQLGDNYKQITDLTISGELNGTDIKTLWEMAEKMQSLDMGGVRIVEGGGNYWFDGIKLCYTEDDVFPDYCLMSFNNLTKLVLPSGVKRIGTRSINCPKLESLDVPQHVKIIDTYAFYSCISLRKITLPEGLTTLHDAVFMGCSSLESINLPSSLEHIGAFAFYNCSSLKELHLPETVRTIGGWAFSGCSSLQYVNIPKSCESIGMSLFDGCKNLQELTLYANAEKSLGIFGSGHGIKILNLYFSKITGDFYTGNNLPLLENLNLHEGLQKIDAHALLSNCPKVTSLNIPASVQEINSNTFAESHINQLHFKSNTPPKMDRNWVYWQESTCTLYIPRGSKANYVNAGEPWTLFKEIIEE